MALYADHEGDNISWAGDDLPGWEPWEQDEPDDDRPAGGCAYCEAIEVRDWPEPFGGQPCCEVCFARLIGDESDDPQPFYCHRAMSAVTGQPVIFEMTREVYEQMVERGLIKADYSGRSGGPE